MTADETTRLQASIERLYDDALAALDVGQTALGAALMAVADELDETLYAQPQNRGTKP